MEERPLKPLWYGIGLMLVGVLLMWWSFSSNGIDGAAERGEDAKPDDMACIQVITPAKNPETGEVVDYPTPCDVPDGREIVQPDAVH